MIEIPIYIQRRLDNFIQQHFGKECEHPDLGPVRIDESATVECSNSYIFIVNAARYFETRDSATGLAVSTVIVPKVDFPPHWAPELWSGTEYVKKVARGEMWWSTSGTDTEIPVTYWGKVDPADPDRLIGGVVRRRMADGRAVDEAFTRDLIWKPTEFLQLYDLGHNDMDLVRMSEAEVTEFVRRVRNRLQD